MLFIGDKKSNLISKVIIIMTVVINIGAFFILPNQIFVQINKSHTMSKIIVLAMIPILQILIFNIGKERGELGMHMIALIIMLIADIAVIGMNLL